MSEFEQWFKQERIDQGYVLSDGEPDNAEIGITRDWALLGWQAAKQSMQGVIAELQAQVVALKVKAARWEKCKTMSKQWWLNAMEEAGLKGGRSLDEQIDAAISKGGE